MEIVRKPGTRYGKEADAGVVLALPILSIGDKVIDNGRLGQGGRIAKRAEVILRNLAQNTPHDLA